jgi:outer membrane immunogenic protein
MKKTLLAGAAFAALALGAFPAAAADLATRPAFKAPAVVPVAYNWSGFYVGGHIGHSWGDKDWVQTFSRFPDGTSLPLDRAVGPASVDGFLGGVQLGFNWQAGQWVFGVEGDWSWSDASGCSFHGGTPATGRGTGFDFSGYFGCTDVNWFATVTGRIGVAFDRALLYAKGGIAFADEEHFIGFNGTPRGVPSIPDTDRPGNTRTGWTVGAGLEWALWNNWSAKVEYNFMDFGTDNVTFNYRPGGSTACAAAPCLVERWDIDQQVHVVKLGINYRFGGAPVMARY